MSFDEAMRSQRDLVTGALPAEDEIIASHLSHIGINRPMELNILYKVANYPLIRGIVTRLNRTEKCFRFILETLGDFTKPRRLGWAVDVKDCYVFSSSSRYSVAPEVKDGDLTVQTVALDLSGEENV